MLVSLMMLLCFQVNHSVIFMEKDTKKYTEFLKNKWNSSLLNHGFTFIPVFMENTDLFSWKKAEKKYIEFLKTIWISSCTETRFYFHSRCFFFHRKDTKEVYEFLKS